MLYRKNEKGRYEAVTDRGQIIPFENANEMNAFIELREGLNKLLGKEEKKEFQGMPNTECTVQNEKKTKKTVKIRIHKGTYECDGIRLKRKNLT